MHLSRYLAAICLLWSSVVSAQAAPSETQKNEASEHFRRGVELYQEEAYRAALVEFEHAYRLSPDYRLLYNIGGAKVEVQDYLGAAQSYEAYLSEGGSSVAPERRAQVEEALASLRGRVGRIALTVNRAGAKVYLDDQEIGVTPIPQAILTNLGRHRVLARTDDGASDMRVFDVAGGQVVEVALTLQAPEARPVVASNVQPEAKPWSPYRKAAVVSWSLAGALAVGAVVTGIMTNGESDALDDLLKKAEVDKDLVDDQRDTTRTLAITTDVLGATAIAALGAGTLLWLLDPAQKEQAEDTRATAPRRDLRVGVGLGSINVRGHF